MRLVMSVWFLAANDLVHSKPDRGVWNIGDGINAFLVHPAPGDGGADAGLVLVIGQNDLHPAAGIGMNSSAASRP
jgi:hypothetical protein